MMRALPWMFALSACALAAAGAACGGDVNPSFGPPNGLKGQAPPEPDTTGNPTQDGGGPVQEGGGGSSGGSDGGTTTPDGGGGDGALNPACANVTWSGTVYKIFAAQGDGQCASGTCHGGQQLPQIPDGDPKTAYANLAAYAVSTSGGTKPYFATTGNAADSAVECNLNLPSNKMGICSAAANGMPLSPGTLSGPDKATIDQWVQCGAQNN